MPKPLCSKEIERRIAAGVVFRLDAGETAGVGRKTSSSPPRGNEKGRLFPPSPRRNPVMKGGGSLVFPLDLG